MPDNKTAKEEYNRIRLHLEPFWGTFESNSLALLLLEHFYKISRSDILAGSEYSQDTGIDSGLNQAIKRLEKKEPIQYVLAETEFSGLKFRLNPNVLIPRPETEELVDLIVKSNTLSAPKILDIGTGSGCIAIALGHLIPGGEVIGTDVDENILITARANADYNNVSLSFIKSDILSENIPGSEYDLIVSNPPYIRHCEKVMMDRNVLSYEPELALFVPDDDPLLFYRSIARKAKSSLKKGGYLYFEINEAFGRQTCELVSNEGYEHVELFSDIHDKPRNIRAQRV